MLLLYVRVVLPNSLSRADNARSDFGLIHFRNGAFRFKLITKIRKRIKLNFLGVVFSDDLCPNKRIVILLEYAFEHVFTDSRVDVADVNLIKSPETNSFHRNLFALAEIDQS